MPISSKETFIHQMILLHICPRLKKRKANFHYHNFPQSPLDLRGGGKCHASVKCLREETFIVRLQLYFRPGLEGLSD